MPGHRLRSKKICLPNSAGHKVGKRSSSAFIHFGLRDHSIQRKIKAIMGSVFFISFFVLDEEISCQAKIDFPIHTNVFLTHLSQQRANEHIHSEADRFSLGFSLSIAKHYSTEFVVRIDNRLPLVRSALQCSRLQRQTKWNETSIKN